MARFRSEYLDYMLGGSFDMMDFGDDSFGSYGQEHMSTNKRKTDTSASEARNGKDIQGIPWERLNLNRGEYREMRFKQYKHHENNTGSRDRVDMECTQVEQGRTFYDFQFNTRVVKSTIAHLQLRNLVWATSKHDAYVVQNYSIMHWSSLHRRSKEVLNVAGQIMPTQHNGTSVQPLYGVQISTMAVKDNLMVSGGCKGEFICKCLNSPGVAFCTRLTNDENVLTNAVDIYSTPNGSTQVMTANKDHHVRVLDMENFALLSVTSFPWSVNSTAVSPDGGLLAVVGDSRDCLLTDMQTGKVIGNLTGHLDYSFASAWHPDGHILATGSQDKTCRLWDIRNLSASFSVLKGKMGAIRNIKFSSDGRFMVMAESADFVHIYDAGSEYCRAQEIDLFGEIAGISLSPDTEALYVGVADQTYGSLMEFSRRHQFQYSDSFL